MPEGERSVLRSGKAWQGNRRRRRPDRRPCPTSCRAPSARGRASSGLPYASDRARSGRQSPAGRGPAQPRHNFPWIPDSGRPRHRWRGQRHSRRPPMSSGAGAPDWVRPRRSTRACNNSSKISLLHKHASSRTVAWPERTARCKQLVMGRKGSVAGLTDDAASSRIDIDPNDLAAIQELHADVAASHLRPEIISAAHAWNHAPLDLWQGHRTALLRGTEGAILVARTIVPRHADMVRRTGKRRGGDRGTGSAKRQDK